MGVINVSPDSFAGDGISRESELLDRLRAVVSDADIIDIGGQSTRPGAEIVSEAEELRRVLPAISAARRLTDKPISIDTFKPVVATAALKAGATIINDVHGCRDQAMVATVRDSGTDVVVMHSRGTPQTMTRFADYPRGVVTEVLDFFRQRTADLTQAGIAAERIIIDPGIGFAKTAAQSFELTRHLQDLGALGFRVLYGASMKSFLGHALAVGTSDPVPVAERRTATMATTVYAMLQGVDVIRVHDVHAAVELRRVLACIADPSLIGQPTEARR